MTPRNADTHEQLLTLLQLSETFRTPAADRVRSDLAAAAHHLTRASDHDSIVAFIGGTGTGKSTLVNRLIGSEVTATSFRRTFTAGPVYIAKSNIPTGFAQLTVHPANELPAKGDTQKLVYVAFDTTLRLIDTPDIDGELVGHHALADRIFRWADAVIFLVTPEKYQMTELQPYYRIAQRYALPALYVMNKADDENAAVEYEQLLTRAGINHATVLAVARDDATWQPLPERTLTTQLITALRPSANDVGLNARVADAVQRFNDQLLQPLNDARQRTNSAVAALETLTGDIVDVDVHPLTQQLQRRMRERSVLYLIGPQRILDRVRSVPTTLVRLPRSMWEWTRTGEFKLAMNDAGGRAQSPDFRDVLIEQFQALQSRIDDVIAQHTTAREPSKWKLPVESAGKISDEEIGRLTQWLETRWNATPRDTAVLQKLMKVIPGGQKLSKYSEAAPYLLAIACVTKGAVLGHIDLLILGGYSAVTWLTEKINDEVASMTRRTNRLIAERYQAMANEQVQSAIAWLEVQAPDAALLDRASAALDRLQKR